MFLCFSLSRVHRPITYGLLTVANFGYTFVALYTCLSAVHNFVCFGSGVFLSYQWGRFFEENRERVLGACNGCLTVFQSVQLFMRARSDVGDFLRNNQFVKNAPVLLSLHPSRDFQPVIVNRLSR